MAENNEKVKTSIRPTQDLAAKTKLENSESKIIEGFKFGFGFYLAFLVGSVIMGFLTALIWFVAIGL